MDHIAESRLRAIGLDPTAPPDPANWAALCAAIAEQLEVRESELAHTQLLAASRAEDLDRLLTRTSRHHGDLGNILQEVTKTLAVFSDAIQGDREAQQASLDLARRRFALKLNATLSDDDAIAEDTAALQELGTGLQQVQGGLRELGRALADLVALATDVSASQQQLELAGTVQMMLVPPEHLELPNASVWSWFEPATQCGGDWWTAAALAKDASLLVIGDVTGHGAPSAIIAGTAKGACDLARMGMRASIQTHQLMRMLNRVIIESAGGHYMMTGLALKLTGRSLTYANAGHPTPYLVRGREVTPLGAFGEPPLGAEQVFAYSEGKLELEPGDLLIAYTDGITETENAQGKQLGERALRALVAENVGLGPEQLVNALRKATLAHRGTGAQGDDISLVVLQIKAE